MRRMFGIARTLRTRGACINESRRILALTLLSAACVAAGAAGPAQPGDTAGQPDASRGVADAWRDESRARWLAPLGEAVVAFAAERADAAPRSIALPGGRALALTDARVTRPSPNRWQAVAGVAGDPDARLILSRVGRAWHGVATLADGWVELRGWGEPGDAVRLDAARVDHGAVPACGGALHEAGGAAPGVRSAATEGGGSEYTLLACYTSQSRRAAGGRDAIIARILSGVALSNTTFELSGLDVRVRLVGTLEQPARENDSTFSSTLSFFTAGGNASYPDAGPARDLLGADLMTLLIDRDELCGIAWLFNGSEFRGASVCSWECVGSTGVLVHEMGHNIGCAHDRPNAGSATAPYGYGHRFTGDDGVLYRTIMSYAPGTRIARLSNPDVLFAGVPTGVPIGEPGEAHNAQIVRDNIGAIVAFRTEEGTDANGNFIDDAEDIASGTSRDADGDGVPDEAQTPVLRVGSPADLSHWPDAITSVELALTTAESDASLVEQVRFATGAFAASAPLAGPRRTPLIEDRVQYLGGFDPATGERDPSGARTVITGDPLGNDDPADPATLADNTPRVAEGFDLTEGTLLSGLHVRDGRAYGDLKFAAAFRFAGPGHVRLEDCEFSNLAAEFGDGALSIERRARVTMERCLVRDIPEVGGGAIGLFDLAHLSVIDSVFEDNRTDFFGAAISTFSECSLDLVDSTFRRNASLRGGGAIRMSGGSLHASGCVFEDNAAIDDGGAVLVGGDDLDVFTFRDTIFGRNTAGGSGGAVASNSLPSVGFAGVTLVGNRAEAAGGAIALPGEGPGGSGRLIVHASRIVGNTAGGDGGGIAVGPGGNTVAIASSVIASNRAGGVGGGVALPPGTTPTIDASTVSGNHAASFGGVSAPDSVLPQLTGSVYWANTDDGWGGDGQAGESAVRDANLRATWSGFAIVERNCVQDGGPGDGDVFPGPGTIDLDPEFLREAVWGDDAQWGTADDDLGDWRPAPSSPVVDAGSAAWLSRDWLDLDRDGDTTERVPFGVDGRARVVGAGPDMGAAEAAAACSLADLASPFGTLDMADIAAFMQSFDAGTPLADTEPDGLLDLRDVVAFVVAFTGGCPG